MARNKFTGIPGSRPRSTGLPFNVSPSLYDIQEIKRQATEEAVRQLSEKFEKSEAELKRLQIEAYNEALNDAEEYILILACRALFNLYGFGYKRQERFLDELMRLLEVADIEVERQWLKDMGFELELTDVGDEVKKGGNHG